MKIFEGTTVNDCYAEALNAVSNYGDRVGNTRELRNVVLHIKEPRLTGMSFAKRKLSTKYAKAELEWYWSANNKCADIGTVAKKWLEITDDGETSNSAYGYILFKKYKNQLEEVIQLLKKDPDTRRAVLNISDPAIDRINTKDMQCTIAVQFLVRNGSLDTTVYMRSNDIIYGFPYDYIFFMSLSRYICYRCGFKVGEYIHNATSLHLYDKDVEKLVDHDQRVDIDPGQFFDIYETEVLNEK